MCGLKIIHRFKWEYWFMRSKRQKNYGKYELTSHETNICVFIRKLVWFIQLAFAWLKVRTKLHSMHVLQSQCTILMNRPVNQLFKHLYRLSSPFSAAASLPFFQQCKSVWSIFQSSYTLCHRRDFDENVHH